MLPCLLTACVAFSNVSAHFSTFRRMPLAVQYNAKEYYSGNAYASCTAGAYAEAIAATANGQAKVVKGIWENTCNPYSSVSKGEYDFETEAKAWAFAYVQVCATTLVSLLSLCLESS